MRALQGAGVISLDFAVSFLCGTNPEENGDEVRRGQEGFGKADGADDEFD
jgi:hypothetical protein